MQKSAKIIGTGAYLPAKVLTNQDFESIVETTDEWITKRTGIKERRIAAPDEYTSDMGFRAGEMALKDAGVAPEEVDLIIFATITPDYLFPSTACLIQAKLGAVNATAFDMQAACSGMIFGLSMAKAYIESGMYRKILVVAADKLSTIVDYEDRSTCVLFGDGASACVVSDEGRGLSINHVNLGADGQLAELITQPAGGSRVPASADSVQQKMHFIRMEGREVFKHAVRHMESAAKLCLKQAGLKDEDVNWFIAHQANIRIIEAIAERFSMREECVIKTIKQCGNTSASSVGIGLDDIRKKGLVKAGDHIIIVGFGAGLAWGAALLTQDQVDG